MRIVVLGNAGAGKSTYAARRAAGRDIARLSLDDIAWDEGPARKPLAESEALLARFLDAHDAWIVEGCYADLAEAALARATELVFLNPGVDACVAHCRARPFEPEKFATKAEQDAALDTLVAWVREYETRDDEYGLRRHRAVHDAFPGPKREHTSAVEYGA